MLDCAALRLVAAEATRDVWAAVLRPRLLKLLGETRLQALLGLGQCGKQLDVGLAQVVQPAHRLDDARVAVVSARPLLAAAAAAAARRIGARGLHAVAATGWNKRNISLMNSRMRNTLCQGCF